jgi:hypothetical protein
MARQATPVELLQVEEAEEVSAPLPVAEEVATVQVVTAQPTTKSVRVKGTWTMYWGSQVWDFADGQRYDLPVDLFDYLKAHSNIYDTI